MVCYITEWRATPPQAAELQKYETFSYPGVIIPFPFKDTWKLPSTKLRDGLSIHKLLRGQDLIKLMPSETHCAVRATGDGRTLYFGANSSEEIFQAKKKMDNILRYYVSILKECLQLEG
jgi:hypothetical protein